MIEGRYLNPSLEICIHDRNTSGYGSRRETVSWEDRRNEREREQSMAPIEIRNNREVRSFKRKTNKGNNVTREQEEVEIETRHCGESRAAETDWWMKRCRHRGVPLKCHIKTDECRFRTIP